MCTMIATSLDIAGSATSGDTAWAKVKEATISFDHATHAWTEHALRLDVFGDGSAAGHIAVEMDLASGKALLSALADVIAAAERTGLD
jgi:hypothetical protein